MSDSGYCTDDTDLLGYPGECLVRLIPKQVYFCIGHKNYSISFPGQREEISDITAKEQGEWRILERDVKDECIFSLTTLIGRFLDDV